MYGNLFGYFLVKGKFDNIEKINRKAMRIVVNDYTSSYADILSTMKRCPQYVSRLKSMATEMIYNSPTFIENRFTLFTLFDNSYEEIL